jgi:hypothetical protein
MTFRHYSNRAAHTREATGTIALDAAAAEH